MGKYKNEEEYCLVSTWLTASRLLLLIAVALNAVSLFAPQWDRDPIEGGNIYVAQIRLVMAMGFLYFFLILPIVVVLLVIVDYIVAVIKLVKQNVQLEVVYGIACAVGGVVMIICWFIFYKPPWIIQNPQAGESDRLNWSVGIGMIAVLVSYCFVLVQGILVIGCSATAQRRFPTLVSGDSEVTCDWGALVISTISLVTAIAFSIYLYSAMTQTCTIEDASSLIVPDGFEVEIFASGVHKARQMAYSAASGIVYSGSLANFGTSSEGIDSVYAIIDSDNDGVADEVITLVDNFLLPSGIALSESGDLYVACVNILYRFPDIDSQVLSGQTTFNFEIVTEDLPSELHHGWRYLRFGPDGLLYFPVGSPCNICERTEDPYFSIITLNVTADGQIVKPEGSDNLWKIFSRGVRNSVGYEFHPITQEFWWTDNGRDWLGSDLPHDELNRSPVADLDFGFPYCFDDNLPDPNFNNGSGCDAYVAPAQLLEPHAAAVGMTFYTGTSFPAKYHNSILIAEHGSWNSNTPKGYKVSLVTLDATGTVATSYSTFLSGFVNENTETACGRPADVINLPDGSILVSDDHADNIYRITYTGN